MQTIPPKLGSAFRLAKAGVRAINRRLFWEAVRETASISAEHSQITVVLTNSNLHGMIEAYVLLLGKKYEFEKIDEIGNYLVRRAGRK